MTATANLDAAMDLEGVLPPDLAARVLTTVSPRARRISLRVDPGSGAIVLVRPKRASLRAVKDFVAEREDWIRAQLAALPPHVPFVDGAVIPVSGIEHTLRLVPEQRGGVWRDANAICVSGRPEFAARRTRDWLKAEARRVLTPMVQQMAAFLGERVTRVTMRDTSSRWGSCSADGKLSFSWRLILAPHSVLVYVAAHEVAHLKHLHHGPTFWRSVDAILDDYVQGPEARRAVALARDWLRRSGATLHRYG